MSFLQGKRRKQLKKCTRGFLQAFKNYQLCITTALSTELKLDNNMVRTTNLRMRVGNSTGNPRSLLCACHLIRKTREVSSRKSLKMFLEPFEQDAQPTVKNKDRQREQSRNSCLWVVSPLFRFRVTPLAQTRFYIVSFNAANSNAPGTLLSPKLQSLATGVCRGLRAQNDELCIISGAAFNTCHSVPASSIIALGFHLVLWPNGATESIIAIQTLGLQRSGRSGSAVQLPRGWRRSAGPPGLMGGHPPPWIAGRPAEGVGLLWNEIKEHNAPGANGASSNAEDLLDDRKSSSLCARYK